MTFVNIFERTCIYIYIYLYKLNFPSAIECEMSPVNYYCYRVATISRLLEIIGLFWKRDL